MTPRSMFTRVAAVAMLGVALFGLAACSDDSSNSSNSSSTTAAASAGVTIQDPWSMNATMSQGNGAAFMTIENNTGVEDELLSGSVAASIAKEVQLHDVVMQGDMMKMTQVQSIAVPANGSVALKHGSYHIMLMQLAAPLEVGKTFELTLQFKNAGTVKVTVPIEAG